MTPMTKDREPLLSDERMALMRRAAVEYVDILKEPWRSDPVVGGIVQQAFISGRANPSIEAEQLRADRAKLLELVRQAVGVVHKAEQHITRTAPRMGIGCICNCPVIDGHTKNCEIMAFLSRCKEVVPDLLVDGKGDEGAPPSGSGSPLQSAEDGRISASILSANGWIPVGERLPEHGQEVVLEWMSFGNQLRKSVHYANADDPGWVNGAYLRWMPLPPSPTEP